MYLIGGNIPSLVLLDTSKLSHLVPRMTSPDGEGAGDVDMSPALLMPQDPTPIAKHSLAKIFLYHQYVLERQWP